METKRFFKYALGVIFVIVLVGVMLKNMVNSSTYKNCAPKQIMTIANPPTGKATPNIKNVDVYMDFSGSMRGYVDFSTPEGKATMIPIVCKAMTKLDDLYGIESRARCENKSYNQKGCEDALSNRKIFNEHVTLLDKMIEKSCDNLSDSSIAIIVSDMILSYGRSKLIQEKDTFYNQHHLQGLGSKIFNQATKLKQKSMHIVILQFLSDYNGKWYCNFTENLQQPIQCRNEILRNRPFYVMIIGSKANVIDIMEKNVFSVSEKPQHIYSTISSSFTSTSPSYTFESESVDWTFLEGENDSTDIVCFSLEGQNLDDEQSKITIAYDPKNIVAPSYVNQELIVEADSNIFNKYLLDQRSGKINMTLQAYNKLGDENLTTIQIVSSNRWVEESDLDDDVKISINDLSGKTWGLKTLVDNISSAYAVENQTPIAKINILLTK